MGQFMVVLDATIVNVALPSIQTDLVIPDSSLQWIVNAYTLVFGGFLLLGGRAADLIGRRTLFIAGIVVFTGASLLNALAQSEEMLIAGRALQGLGGALLSPAALAVITTTFAEGSERTKALAVWAAIASRRLGRRPAARRRARRRALLGVDLRRQRPDRARDRVRRVAPRAELAASSRPSATSTSPARSRSPPGSRCWSTRSSRRRTGAGARSSSSASPPSALALLGAFIAIELRSPAPLVRLGLFRLRSLALGNGVFLILMAGMFSMFFFASIYVQNVLGYSALTTGLAFLPVTAGIMIGATAAQQLVPRLGVRRVTLIGMPLAADRARACSPSPPRSTAATSACSPGCCRSRSGWACRSCR